METTNLHVLALTILFANKTYMEKNHTLSHVILTIKIT